MAVLAAKRLLKEGTLKLGAGGDTLLTDGSGAVDWDRGNCETSAWNGSTGCVDIYAIDRRFFGLVRTGGLCMASRGGGDATFAGL